MSGLFMGTTKAHASTSATMDNVNVSVQSKNVYPLSSRPNNDGLVTPMGVKSTAVIKVANALRAGGDVVIDAAKHFKVIDGSTARTLKRNSKKIGNWLKKFENAGDTAAAQVREQLPVFLKENTKMSKGTAENISIAVSWAIKWTDVIFL